MRKPACVRMLDPKLSRSNLLGSREIPDSPSALPGRFPATSSMFTYSKLAQAAIAAVSYLASPASKTRLIGSAEIAKVRELSQQVVAKVLTILSHHGMVIGTPGPNGGYRLARPPAEISLLDVVKVFEDPEDRVMCPFGPNWCGNGPKCPLHDAFAEMHKQTLDRLASETFAQFGHSS